tara:strand:- start:2369 stop:2647 length:279 start_codon:yes stop_codon:yes gene_type:complete
MAFTEDLNIFLADFGDTVEYQGVLYKGILEQPDEIVADDRVLTTDYQLTVKTTDLGSLLYDTELKVDSEKYIVRSARKIDDGSLSVISLMKV